MKTTLYNDKILDIIASCVKPEVRQLTLEGTIRSAKTVAAIEGFYYRVFYSQETTHVVASNDTDTLKNNILESDGFGLTTKFAFNCKIVQDKIGGNYLSVKGYDNQEKKILLVTYANRSKWKKILGGTIESIFIDEANIADPQFINECYARQVSCAHPFTLYTLNGDAPTASIYNYINPSKILGTAPAGIRADMDKTPKKDGYYYFHCNFADNPVMTPEKIEKTKTLYPIGSYYHTIKILGERGAPGRLIYIDYISDELVKHLNYTDYHIFTVGVDIGATRAQNSITLTGFNRNYTECAVLDKYTFLQCGYKQKTEIIKNVIYGWLSKGIYIEVALVDSAEQNYIADLKSEFKKDGKLPDVAGSYKATIKERIDMSIILMSTLRIRFNDTPEGKNALQAFKISKWVEGKEGQEREDNNEWQNDVMDSVEYSLTRHMKALMKAKR